MIFNDFINGEGFFFTLPKKVNALGFRTRFGKQFENRSIEYILNNPAYKGYARWTPTGKGYVVKQNFSRYYYMTMNLIIDEKTFDEVQELLKVKRNTPKILTKVLVIILGIG